MNDLMGTFLIVFIAISISYFTGAYKNGSSKPFRL